MFNWVKKLFGTESVTQDKYFVDWHGSVSEVVVSPKTEKVAPPPAPKAKPAAKKAAPKKAETKATKHTKASLGKLTKAEIDALAKVELGVDLDRRKTKDDMIKEFLAAYKK
jgi:hypothetical protein